MADQLYLSYRLADGGAPNIIRAYEKLVKQFPYSRLSKGATVLRVHAVRAQEPPVIEQPFEDPLDPAAVLAPVREYAAADAGIFLDTRWDLWQFETEWKLAPSRVTLACFGPEFESEPGEHIRVDFGIDTHYLPQHGIANALTMARSNVRSLLHLVHELDKAYGSATRRLWTESGENFAEKLQAALETETD